MRVLTIWLPIYSVKGVFVILSGAKDLRLRMGDPSASEPALSERSESNGRLRMTPSCHINCASGVYGRDWDSATARYVISP